MKGRERRWYLKEQKGGCFAGRGFGRLLSSGKETTKDKAEWKISGMRSLTSFDWIVSRVQRSHETSAAKLGPLSSEKKGERAEVNGEEQMDG